MQLTRSIVSTGLVLLALCSHAAAQPAMTFEPSATFPAPDVTATKNYTGNCDTAVVRVMGVTSVNDDFFDTDEGRIIVRQGSGGELVIDGSSGLSDHNGMACVTAQQKTRLLIWSNCGGSACGDDYGFIVVDPETLKIISPDAHSGCDEMCAYSLTGSRLPWTINGKTMP